MNLKFFRNLNLGIKLNIVIVLAFGMLLLAIVLVTNRGAQALTAQSGEQRVRQEIEVIQRRIEEAEKAVLRNAKILGSAPDLIDAVAKKDIRIILSTILVHGAPLGLEDIDLVDQEGKRLEQEAVGGNLHAETEEKLISRALSGIDATGIIIEEAHDEQELLLAAAIPLRDRSGQIIGALLAGQEIDNGFLKKLNFARTNVHLVLMRGEEILAYDDKQEIPTFSPTLVEYVRDNEVFNSKNVISNELLFYEDHPHALGYVTIGGDIKATIAIISELDDLFLFQNQLISNTTLIFSLLALVVMVTMAWFSRRSITAPISDLKFAAEKMANGDYLQHRAEVRNRDEIGQLAAAFNNMADAIEAREKEITQLNRRLKAENLRLGTELDVTRRVQRMILPTQDELQGIKKLDIASFMEPADEVGGDYLDVLQHNGQVKIGIGDVTGHGLESGMLMLMTQTAVRTLLVSGETDPARFLNILNRTIYDNVQRMQANKSLSLSLLDYNNNGQLRLSGQHEELILVRQGGKIELIDTMNLGFPIGLDDDITDFVDEALIKLQPGDGIVLYTDGITEAENLTGEQYGLERMCSLLSHYWAQSAETIKDTIIEDLRSFIGQQKIYDDITLLVLKQV